MLQSVEIVGPYKVSNYGDGRYSVTCANGNIGARMATEEDVQKLRDKYESSDSIFTKGDKQITEKEANIRMFLTPGLFKFLPTDNREAFEYYANKEGTVTNKARKIARTLATIALGAVAGIAYIKYGNKISGLLKNVPEVIENVPKTIKNFFQVAK